MNDFALNLPINNLSFGSVSVNLLREAKNRGLTPSIFPIGQINLSAQKEDKDFNSWLEAGIKKGLKYHKRSHPVLRLWHIQNSIESLSNKQVLYSFYECNQPTEEELNVISNNYKVVFPCDFNTNTFKQVGAANVVTVPLGFDHYNFKRLDKKFFYDGRIVMGISSKCEVVRKQHAKMIQAWIKKYGNNKKYYLNLSLHNPFIAPEQLNNLYSQIVGGQRFFNVNFLPHMPGNDLFNDYLNSNGIILSCANESWGLGEFQSIALGKHGVISNYGGHTQWADSENSVLVNSSGRVPCQDGLFFHPGSPYNQGTFDTFDENEFLAACDTAIERYNKNPINEAGLKLQEKFKYSETFDKLYNLLQE